MQAFFFFIDIVSKSDKGLDQVADEKLNMAQ